MSFERRPRQVEIEEHRLTVRRQQNIRGLQIEMNQAALVSVVKRVGQTRSNPAGGSHIIDAGKKRAGRPLDRTGRHNLGVFQCPEQRRARSPRGCVSAKLVENAIEHTSDGELIEVRLDQAGTLEVADNGPGIADAVREKIFTPFWRGAVSGQGAGLGLAIVQRIAELYGAELSVANAPAGGARFRLRFKPAPSFAAAASGLSIGSGGGPSADVPPASAPPISRPAAGSIRG